SIKTTSVNSCCAWSVMPMVTMSPAGRTHSCDFAYLRSAGTFAIRELSQGLRWRSIWFSIEGLGRDQCPGAFAANFNFDTHLRFRMLRPHVSHANPNTQGRTLCTANNLADLRRIRLRTPNRVARTRRGRPLCHLERDQFPAYPAGFLLGQDGSPD